MPPSSSTVPASMSISIRSTLSPFRTRRSRHPRCECTGWGGNRRRTMIERPTLQHRLNTARLTRFVGRESEIARFRAALDAPDIAILFLHGPGGVGKSSLLDVFAHHAAAGG